MSERGDVHKLLHLLRMDEVKGNGKDANVDRDAGVGGCRGKLADEEAESSATDKSTREEEAGDEWRRGFLEERRLEVSHEFESDLVERCCVPKGPVHLPESARRRLELLLRAHAHALAMQKSLDANALVQTFSPLLQLVQELQGNRADKVFLGPGVHLYVKQVPEDLRKYGSQCATFLCRVRAKYFRITALLVCFTT